MFRGSFVFGDTMVDEESFSLTLLSIKLIRMSTIQEDGNTQIKPNHAILIALLPHSFVFFVIIIISISAQNQFKLESDVLELVQPWLHAIIELGGHIV